MRKYITTLNKIKSHKPCKYGWETLLKHLGKTKSDDEPLEFLTILKSNGVADTVWCMRSAPEFDKEWRLFAVFCARSVAHLLKDPRSIAAINVAERFAHGMATVEEMGLARENAEASAGDVAGYAAYIVAYAYTDAAYVAEAAYAAASREKQERYLTELFY